MLRVTLITAGFGPYRVPLWNSLSDHCELSIIFLSAKEKIRSWDADISNLKADAFVLDSKQIFVHGMDWSLNLVYRPVKKLLDEIKPEVLILGGYESPGYWAARSWAKKNKIPIVLWMESTLLSTRTKGVRLIEKVKSFFIRSCDAYYVPGRLSAEYLAYFGAPYEKIVIGNGVCDISKFKLAKNAEENLIPVLLYVGRLTEPKGMLKLIDALGDILDLPWKMRIAGDGLLKNQVLELSIKGGFADRLEMLGYISQDDLSAVYRSADVFLFPTLNDVWGLVVNEALLSGLYVAGSNRAAASLELIKPGLNGEIVNPFDKKELAEGIRRALNRMPFDRQRIRQTIEHITPEGEALKLMEALNLAEHSRVGNV